jgi:hypothetical protein
MAACTLGQLVGRVSSLVAAPPMSFEQAAEPFSFDLQPDTHLDQTFCIATEGYDVHAYFGYAQANIDLLIVRLARKTLADPTAAARLLENDVSSLQSLIVRDGVYADYSGEVAGWRMKPPAPNDNFVMVELEVTVDYDQAL